MNVIPSIDIQSRRCVKLVQGKRDTGLTFSDSPLQVASRWQSEGARILHIVDLDGAMEGTKLNRSIIREILSLARVPVQVGGGIRTVEDVSDYLDSGATWVVLGTAAIEQTSFLEAVTGKVGAGRVIVALDFSGDTVLTRGWKSPTHKSPAAMLRALEDTDIYGFLLTDVSVEGTMTGVDLERIRSLTAEARKPIIYSGGVSTLEDLKALATTGVSGVVVGMALYEGRFSLSEAQGVADEASS